MKKLSFYFLLLFGLFSQEISYDLQRTSSKITLDGKVTEAEWGGIKELPLTMASPLFKGDMTEKTIAYVSYDNDYFYFAAKLYDSEPKEIRTNSLKRDNWDVDDVFGVVLDSFNDNENALVFMVTPEGVRIDWAVFGDAVSFGGEPFNSSWNAFWEAKTLVTDEGWFVEARIPFSSLKFKEVNGEVSMGLLAYRYIPRKNEAHNFPLIDPKHDWGFIKPSLGHNVVLKGIKSKNPIYLTPYVLSGLQNEWNENSKTNRYEKESDWSKEIGLDLKYNINDNLTMDLTLNTDFAQVEADDEQVNLSQFSLFFPEKRLFFQERSSLFDFGTGGPTKVFYSRRIGLSDSGAVRILGGLRTVGRIGKWDIGLLNMQTEGSSDFASENFSVFRMKRQVINPYSTAGLIFTSRLGDDGSTNYVYGLDANIRLGNSDQYLTTKWIQSFDHEEDQNIEKDFLERSRIILGVSTRRNEGFAYNLFTFRSGEIYDPGIGFLTRENFTGIFGQLAYGTIFDKESSLQSRRIYLRSFTALDNNTSRSEQLNVVTGASFNTKSGASFGVELALKQLRLTDELELPNNVFVPEDYYHFYDFSLNYSSPFGDLFKYFASAKLGKLYDGSFMRLSLSPNWAYSKHWSFSARYEYNQAKFSERKEDFKTHLAQLRLNYALDQALSFSLFSQFNSDDEKWSLNGRARYNFAEGTDLYLVYNAVHNLNRFREEPILPKMSNQTVLLKFNYTLQI